MHMNVLFSFSPSLMTSSDIIFYLFQRIVNPSITTNSKQEVAKVVRFFHYKVRAWSVPEGGIEGKTFLNLGVILICVWGVELI